MSYSIEEYKEALVECRTYLCKEMNKYTTKMYDAVDSGDTYYASQTAWLAGIWSGRIDAYEEMLEVLADGADTCTLLGTFIKRNERVTHD